MFLSWNSVGIRLINRFTFNINWITRANTVHSLQFTTPFRQSRVGRSKGRRIMKILNGNFQIIFLWPRRLSEEKTSTVLGGRRVIHYIFFAKVSPHWFIFTLRMFLAHPVRRTRWAYAMVWRPSSVRPFFRPSVRPQFSKCFFFVISQPILILIVS